MGWEGGPARPHAGPLPMAHGVAGQGHGPRQQTTSRWHTDVRGAPCGPLPRQRSMRGQARPHPHQTSPQPPATFPAGDPPLTPPRASPAPAGVGWLPGRPPVSGQQGPRSRWPAPLHNTPQAHHCCAAAATAWCQHNNRRQDAGAGVMQSQSTRAHAVCMPPPHCFSGTVPTPWVRMHSACALPKPPPTRNGGPGGEAQRPRVCSSGRPWVQHAASPAVVAPQEEGLVHAGPRAPDGGQHAAEAHGLASPVLGLD
jgi:hypothetical protein